MARKDINSVNTGGNEERAQDNFTELYSYAGNISGAVGFGSLPAGVIGKLYIVSNSTTNVWGATIASATSTASGDTVLAWFNGTNWTVAGK